VKTEIINKSHGNGYLQLKVFKILNPKKGPQGTSDDSESFRGGVNTNQGNKNVRALIEETQRRMEDLSTEEIQKRIQQMT
jgi:Icc-related predicted phosphoesterase